MSLRRVPPVLSPVAPGSLVSGALVSLGLGRPAGPAVAAQLRRSADASAIALTDSGTSALVLALRASAGVGGVVAMPAWGCIDLSAAAAFAGVRVRLYDLDPETLSPDLDSLRETLSRGVDAIVVAHFFGYPADLIGVRALADAHGVPVVEDAAQAAGGALRETPLGGFGDLVIRSFGRGKGTTGGTGGALLARGDRFASAVAHAAATLPRPSRGARHVIVTAAQWLLARPSLYAIPASLPGLRLGEMIYHPAREPAGMPEAALAILRGSLAIDAPEVARRRANAARLARYVADRAAGWRRVRPVAGGRPGYLRYPVRARGDEAAPESALGVVRPYPLTLAEHEPMRTTLLPGERAGAGAWELSRRLLVLPTHSRLSRADVARLGRWLGAPEAVGVPVSPANGVA
ncbi:MAG TPA: DegT/DnrJ/EryC1/StrS family aminotransferase [Gemmatimonadaceae bacterium]|nr:DegT/DnrJ/EryC1/StrS family aminotransferase [Gemmatimonadaceae bacterium]